jgi:plasmid stabilization system protein ParE
MGQLIFSQQEKQDIKAIPDYIRTNSPLNVKRVRVAIIDKCKDLVKHPGVGRVIIQTSVTTIRQILVYKYRIFYREINDDIEIVSIYYSSRLIKNNSGLQQFFEDQ